MALKKYTRLKYLVSINTEHAVSNEGYVGLENVESWSGRKIETNTPEAEGVALSYQKGDVLFGKLRPYLAKCYVAEEDACCSMEFLVMRPKKVVSKYLQYRILSAEFIDKVNMSTYGAKMPRANWSFIGNLKLDVPSMEEQQLIANYLDDRCSKIDAIIAEAKASIEEYKELKQALISSKVLCGMQPKVSKKTTNEKWLTEIPKHWRFEKGRHLFYETNVRSTTGTEELLTVSQYTGITPRSQKNVTMIEAESLEDYKICEVGDIAANTMWMWAGAVGVSSYYGVISPSYNTYRQLHNDFNDSYLDYLLRTPEIVCEYASRSTGIRASRLRLYPAQFLSIYFPVPPQEEQIEIVEYLEQRLPQMDALISEKQSLIADLEAYKKSLIYEVVTGKRKVVA